jgi:xanthine dehydrogenase YagT iron-sulfur-binding subunit
VTLKVNGGNKSLTIDARTTLLDALREHAGLTGSKKGCDHGQCGACTVLIEGRRVLSCLTLAMAAQGQQITTIEGHASSDDDIREFMSGNICRCAAYPNIVAAVKQAAPAISSDQQKG